MKYLLVFLSLSACTIPPAGTTFADLYDPVCFEPAVAIYVLENDRAAALAIAKNNATGGVKCR